jgi:hypothetical protein
VWPTLRRSETELGKQIEESIGADRFHDAFTTGSALSRRDAVAMVRGRDDLA